MELLGKVRRMFYRDKLSRSEISRRTGLSRNTIKKWLDAAEGAAPKYRRESTPGKLTPFHAFLLQALEADAHRDAAKIEFPQSPSGRGAFGGQDDRAKPLGIPGQIQN